MKKETICVIGMNGYVGSHVMAELLKQGYSVNGTLRAPKGAHTIWIEDEMVHWSDPEQQIAVGKHFPAAKTLMEKRLSK